MDKHLILSPVPLKQALRETHDSPAAVFMDLSTLRRSGVHGALRTVRNCGVSVVTVTGETADLAVFRDILILIAMSVPRAERRYAPPGATPRHLRLTDIPLSVGRLLYGATAGFEALITNTIRLNRLERHRGKEHQTGRQPLRCLYLKPALSFGALIGGSVGHIAGVANAMNRAGKEVRILACAKQPHIDPSIPQVVVPPPSCVAYPHELNRFRYHRKFLRSALQEVSRFRPDFIYQRYTLNDMSGAFLRRHFGIPLILEYNGSETWIQHHWGDPLTFHSTAVRIERTNLASADLVVVVSDEIRKQVCALGIPERKVLFYPNCVDSSMFDPARFGTTERRKIRQDFGIPLDANLFTFVGTFGQWHGTEVLAAAIRKMADQDHEFARQYKIHFLMLGDGQYGERVRSILKGIPIVTLPGSRPQSETPGILAASDVCVSPHVPNMDGTPFFGSPTKLFEYMAMGKPIIASDLDQIGSVLRGWLPGDLVPSNSDPTKAAAILVNPGDIESLIRAIRTAARMEDGARRSLGDRARQLVLQAFTWEANVSAVLKRFDDLIRDEQASGTSGT